MKLFISWSGDHSLAVATALRRLLPDIFDGLELFLSTQDIRKGGRWLEEIGGQLAATIFGIVCLTRENLEEPWLLYEAGAISKSVKKASLYTLLVDGLRPGDIQGPLSTFQHTVSEKDDVFELVKSINGTYGEAKQDEAKLRRKYEKLFWDEFDKSVTAATPNNIKVEEHRKPEEMLYQLIETTNQIARTCPNTEILAEKISTLLASVNDIKFAMSTLISRLAQDRVFETPNINQSLAGDLTDMNVSYSKALNQGRSLISPLNWLATQDHAFRSYLSARHKILRSRIPSISTDKAVQRKLAHKLKKANIRTYLDLISKTASELLTLGFDNEDISLLNIHLASFEPFGFEIHKAPAYDIIEPAVT